MLGGLSADIGIQDICDWWALWSETPLSILALLLRLNAASTQDFAPFFLSTTTTTNSIKNDRIEAALAALDSQEMLNYTAAARELGIHPTTLWRRYTDISVSQAKTNSTHRQRLNNTEEDTLSRHTDSLTDRLIYIAEEILKGPAEKNWTGQFRSPSLAQKVPPPPSPVLDCKTSTQIGQMCLLTR